MVICELANGAEPFAGVSTTLMLTEKVRGCVPQLLDCTTVPTDENNEVHGNNIILLSFFCPICTGKRSLFGFTILSLNSNHCGANNASLNLISDIKNITLP